MVDTGLHKLVGALLDFVRTPATPFEDLHSIGDSFVVVGGDVSLVRAVGKAYTLSSRGCGKDFEYTVCSSGVVVTLVESDDPQYSSVVHLDPEHGFLSVDKVRVLDGHPQGVCLVDPGNEFDPGGELGETLAKLAVLPDEVSADLLCRKTADVAHFFTLSDAASVDVEPTF
jgi:hypothetical protein